MHRRPASFGVSCRAAGETFACEEWRSGRNPTHRTGEDGQVKAMVLAAGLGTRLRPLTNDRPKALVEINGRTLLEITLARLRQFGVGEVIINAHHFATKIADYLLDNNNFGMTIEISEENLLLDTGGGLKKAAHFFLRDGADEPFFLHNVDVLSNIDLADMLQFHREHD